MRRNVRKIIVLSVLAFILLWTQGNRADPSEEEETMILRLQEEIRQIEARFEQTEQGRRGVAEEMEDLDREIELRRRLVVELNEQSRRHISQARQIASRIRDSEVQLVQLTDALAVQEEELASLRQLSGQRMNYMYRRLNAAKLTLLFSSTELNDLSQRQHYIQAIERQDREHLQHLRRQVIRVRTDRENIQNTRNQLTAQRQQHLRELEQVSRLIQSRSSEEQRLAVERSNKENLLDRISQDTELLEVLLEERRNSLQDIEQEINSLEGRRPTTDQAFIVQTPFKGLRGQLPWPLSRREILHPFGNIRHPQLGTTTINPGIDLKAIPGESVYAVAHGQVIRIAWLRGFGNTIILSHGDGYYTVYARLGQIQTTQGAIVNGGSQIAVVGDSGVEGGFHFEVWAQRDKQNPLVWLER